MIEIIKSNKQLVILVCILAFLVGAFQNLGGWLVYRILNFLELWAVG